MKITVYFDPKAVKPTVIQNATVVLVDVLRTSTAIPVYLYHGAAGVALCPEPATAKKQFEKLKRGEGLLAGERDWDKIPGFHLGGSPLDSSREKVKDRFICLSTPSNLRPLATAKYVVLGSFVNLSDVYDSCLRGKRDVVIVCAGQMEDSAFAGMLVDFLQSTLGNVPIVLTRKRQGRGQSLQTMAGKDTGPAQGIPGWEGTDPKRLRERPGFLREDQPDLGCPFLEGKLFPERGHAQTQETPGYRWKAKTRIGSTAKREIHQSDGPSFPEEPRTSCPGHGKGERKKKSRSCP